MLEAVTLATANGAFLLASGRATGQQIEHAAAFDLLDLNGWMLGQALPAASPQLRSKAFQVATARGQHVAAAWPTQEADALLADHAAIHDPHALGPAKAAFDLGDDAFDGLQIAGVAGQGVMSQWKALAGDDQRDDNLLTVAAMVARVATAGQVVFLGQALEVAAGQIVQEQVVVNAEENAVALFQ